MFLSPWAFALTYDLLCGIGIGTAKICFLADYSRRILAVEKFEQKVNVFNSSIAQHEAAIKNNKFIPVALSLVPNGPKKGPIYIYQYMHIYILT